MNAKLKCIAKSILIVIAVVLGIGLLGFACLFVKFSILPQSHPHPGMPADRVMMFGIERAIDIYTMRHNGKLPESLDDLIQGTDDNPPILKKESIADPWGSPVGYERDRGKFVLFSSGPDKKMMTQDDIVHGNPSSYEESWKRKQIRLLYGLETDEVQEEPQPSPANRGGTEQSKAVPVPTPAAVKRAAQPPLPDLLEHRIPWKLPLLIDVAVGIYAVATWLCFRKSRDMSMKRRFSILRVLLLLGIVLGVMCSGFVSLLLYGYIESSRWLYRNPPDPTLPTHYQISAITRDVATYRLAFDKLPDSLDAFIDGKYFMMSREDLTDQWGEPLGYRHNGEDYVVFSSGPDKKLGTGDDISRTASSSHEGIRKSKYNPPADGAEANAVQEATP